MTTSPRDASRVDHRGVDVASYRHLAMSGPRNREGSRRCGEIIPCSDLRQTSNNIIQKGLASGREQSGSVTVPGASRASGSCPAGCLAKVGLRWWRQRRRTNAMEDPDGKTYRYATR